MGQKFRVWGAGLQRGRVRVGFVSWVAVGDTEGTPHLARHIRYRTEVLGNSWWNNHLMLMAPTQYRYR
jgi:hypothetical protein